MTDYDDYEKPNSCYCSTTSHPPCSFCTDTNYCEECDINTWNETCPECGKNLEEE